VGEPAHFLQPSQAIFPVHHLDEVPHDQTPLLIGNQAGTMSFRAFFAGSEKWFHRLAAMFRSVLGDETASQGRDHYSS
jgi:hypothetical protein